ncbi:MAG: AAA family ATPase [Bryobacteraceae bacterium]
MLSGVIICPDTELADSLAEALSASRRVLVLRKVERYPNEAELGPLLRAIVPQCVFLSVGSFRDAADVAERIQLLAPGTQIVAFHNICDADTLLNAMRAGMRQFVAPPFDHRNLSEVLTRVEEAVESNPPSVHVTDAVCAYLPAKAGAGASTMAVNSALALARRKDASTLLIDLDVNAGIVGFMLQLRPAYTVLDAIENSPDLDEYLWSKLITKSGDLDVLPAGAYDRDVEIHASQLRRLIEFTRRNYRSVVIDLPGPIDRNSIAMLQEANRIFLVVTPDLPALHLARCRLDALRRFDLDDRVSVVLNQYQKGADLPVEEMEKVFGRKVEIALPPAKAHIHKALVTGKPVDVTSDLGKRFEALGELMLPKQAPKVEARRGLFGMLALQKNA